jgi:hypothetical protein
MSRRSLEFSELWDSRRPVRTWTRKLRKIRLWKPLLGDNRWRYGRLRTLSTFSNELQSVWISDSAILPCSHDPIIFLYSSFLIFLLIFRFSYPHWTAALPSRPSFVLTSHSMLWLSHMCLHDLNEWEDANPPSVSTAQLNLKYWSFTLWHRIV